MIRAGCRPLPAFTLQTARRKKNDAAFSITRTSNGASTCRRERFARKTPGRAGLIVQSNSAQSTASGLLADLKAEARRTIGSAHVVENSELTLPMEKIIHFTDEMIATVPMHIGLVVIRRAVDQLLA